MKPTAVFILFSLALLPLTKGAALNPETSVVEIEVTKKDYDYRTPWFTRNEQVRKNGILIGENRILTTADGLSGQYLCRIKKGGESRQYTAEIRWIDFYANVALLDVPEAAFWKGMHPVGLAETIPQSGELQIYRWLGGRIEERAAEIIRLFSGRSKMSYVQHLLLLVSSPIDSAGWSEVVFDGDRLVGLTASASKDTLTILPAAFISKVIEYRNEKEDPGLGYFDFNYILGKNPDLLASKGIERRNVGVVVTEVGSKGLSSNALERGDVILEVDGFLVDSEGKYMDPDYGRLSMRSLATRAHTAGESISFKIWRDGKAQVVDYELPRADFDKSLIPEERYDAPPPYLIAGGLVFQPLNGPLMRALGKNTPVLLDYYSQQKSVDGRKGLVVLSGVLPDDYNLGYESIHYALIDKINGHHVENLEDVQTALAEPKDGFHRIQFMPEEGVLHMVLDAGSMPSATSRILQNYRIPNQSQF